MEKGWVGSLTFYWPLGEKLIGLVRPRVPLTDYLPRIQMGTWLAKTWHCHSQPVAYGLRPTSKRISVTHFLFMGQGVMRAWWASTETVQLLTSCDHGWWGEVWWNCKGKKNGITCCKSWIRPHDKKCAIAYSLFIMVVGLHDRENATLTP